MTLAWPSARHPLTKLGLITAAGRDCLGGGASIPANLASKVELVGGIIVAKTKNTRVSQVRRDLPSGCRDRRAGRGKVGIRVLPWVQRATLIWVLAFICVSRNFWMRERWLCTTIPLYTHSQWCWSGLSSYEQPTSRKWSRPICQYKLHVRNDHVQPGSGHHTRYEDGNTVAHPA